MCFCLQLWWLTHLEEIKFQIKRRWIQFLFYLFLRQRTSKMKKICSYRDDKKEIQSITDLQKQYILVRHDYITWFHKKILIEKNIVLLSRGPVSHISNKFITIKCDNRFRRSSCNRVDSFGHVYNPAVDLITADKGSK